MILHITKRELYDNLNSLRFALTTLLLLALMLTNAIGHLREHPKRIQKYNAAVAESLDLLSSHADDSLYKLSQQGPGKLYKKPSPLHFCAEGGEHLLPNIIEGGSPYVYSTNIIGVWQLSYPDASINRKRVGPDVTKVDWAFIIAYVLSLIALLFTFDSIAGEREHGTLRLMLANSVPRHTLLIGKFLGALISVSIPFTLAALMNLLMISTSSTVHLNMEVWGRLGVIFFIAFLYTCFFVAFGLLVSARVQRSAVSLVILLLIWVTFVVFMPSTLASIASEFSPSMPSEERWMRYYQRHNELRGKYSYHLYSHEVDKKTLTAKSEFYTKDVEMRENLNQEFLTSKIAQVQHARSITRVSPATLLQYLLESFAGTGFARHLQFVDNVERYARQYREFVVDIDRSDPESFHIIGVREGMTERRVLPAAVPKFEDTLSLSKDFNDSAMEILLLTMFVVLLLSGTYLAFVRVEV
ncbi:MAG: ABC transporter permease subunit [Candidatus Poribacteria bacterium]|nr:ABC transporter permease subunit [Candidatus Poribacteria bacterium]